MKRSIRITSGLIISYALLVLLAGQPCFAASDNTRREFSVRGFIRGVLPDQKTLSIEHEEIPGFMAAMTMPFALKDPKEGAGLKLGDAISFRLIVSGDNASIDQIKTINPDELRLSSATSDPEPAAKPSNRLRPGDTMPEFNLTDQDGQTITRETFHGRPFVLTFIFTRCPMPTFCPLMNKNFAELQRRIKDGSGAVAEAKLLSISFDPEFDTPKVLKDAASQEQADSKVWMFATGSKEQINELTARFSVYLQPEAGTISHSLTTALIDANGRVVEIWRGNGWKPDEVSGKLSDLQGPP